ncbi:cutinase family protein [Propionibacteriaceae bacterium Y2011]
MRNSGGGGVTAWLGAVLLLMATLLPAAPAHAAGGLTWAPAPAPSGQADEMACADFLFIGARGSLEEPPYGGMVNSWREAFADRTANVPRAGQGTVRELYVDYPAVGPDTLLESDLGELLFGAELPAAVFFDSVNTGVESTTAALQDSQRRCPDEKWILVGYSQGAQVLNEVLADLGPADQLLTAVLLGNPGHHVGQTVTEVAGTAGPEATGLTASMYYIRHEALQGREAGGQSQATADGVRAVLELGQGRAEPAEIGTAADANRLTVPHDLQSRVQSLCNDGDMVCDAGPALYRVIVNQGATQEEIDRAGAPHHAYTPDLVTPAVDRAVSDIRDAIPGPSPVPPPVPKEPVLGPLTIVIGGVGASMLVALAVALVQLYRRREASAALDGVVADAVTGDEATADADADTNESDAYESDAYESVEAAQSDRLDDRRTGRVTER